LEKIALITDTTSDLPEDILKEFNIKVLSFRIIYKDREYKDKIDITPQQVYDNLLNEVPTSSMPSTGDMEELFTALENDGYTHVLAVVLSSGLSGIYNGIKVVSESHPNLKTYICDSQSISLGEGAVVHECGKLIKQGKSFNEIVEAIPFIKKRIHLFFVVGTLEYLKRGGRIGKVSGTIAELLNIKPIISIDYNDGKYITYAKVRGRKQSLNRLIEIAGEITSKKKCTGFILHGDSEIDARKVYDTLKNLPNITELVFSGCISPVSGVHSGPGLIGLVLVDEE